MPVKKRKAKPKGPPSTFPVKPILAGIALVLLVAGLIVLAMQLASRTANIQQLKAAILLVGDAVGAEEVTLEALLDAEERPMALDGLISTTQLRMGDLQTTQLELGQSRTREEQLEAQQAAAQQEAQQRQATIADLEQELLDRRNEWAEEEVALAGRIEELEQAQITLTAEVERLRAERDQAQQALAVATAAPPVVAPEDEPPTQMEVEPEAEAPVPEEEAVDEERSEPAESDHHELDLFGSGSELFVRAWYLPDQEKIRLSLVNGGTLEYTQIDQELFDRWAEAPGFDIFFRKHILLKYPSQPEDDLGVIRRVRN